MARIWKEQFDSTRHSSMPDTLRDAVAPIRRHWTAPTLIPHEVVFVSVCSFTFRFDSREQLQRTLHFYETKILPSTRQPEEVWGLRGGDHGEAERWFEKLPLFLREEPKRVKVVKALHDALNLFDVETP